MVDIPMDPTEDDLLFKWDMYAVPNAERMR